MHLVNGEISLPICSKKCALEVYKRERHDDGLYQAENGRLKICVERLWMTIVETSKVFYISLVEIFA